MTTATEAVPGLKAFIYADPGQARRDTQSRQLCARDGHLPTLRWRGMVLRCYRCTRCGQERRP